MTADWYERSSEGVLHMEGNSDRKWYRLYDKVTALKNLMAAWKRVKENRGKPGSDRESMDQFQVNWQVN